MTHDTYNVTFFCDTIGCVSDSTVKKCVMFDIGEYS